MEEALARDKKSRNGKKLLFQSDTRHAGLIYLLPAQVHLLALPNGTAKRQFKIKTHENLEDLWNVKHFHN